MAINMGNDNNIKFIPPIQVVGIGSKNTDALLLLVRLAISIEVFELPLTKKSLLDEYVKVGGISPNMIAMIGFYHQGVYDIAAVTKKDTAVRTAFVRGYGTISRQVLTDDAMILIRECFDDTPFDELQLGA